MMKQLIEKEALYCGKLGYAAKIGRRKNPDAGDRIAAREQPEVDEVGKIRYSPLSPALVSSLLLTLQYILYVLKLQTPRFFRSTLKYQFSIYSSFNDKHACLIFIVK